MGLRLFGKRMSSFQIIILGFMGVILTGSLLLMLPISVKGAHSASFADALFTATSAVCVTGLVVQDTATYWSEFGHAVILILIQIGGLGVISVAALIAMISGKKISLLQRSMLQETIAAPQLGGIVKMTGFIFRIALIIELIGAAMLLPVFLRDFGPYGIWMAVFHSVSAFCNAGFDLMGDKTGQFSSLMGYASEPGIVLPICLLIMVGGIGFLTWEDIALKRFRFRMYRMQSKVILVTTGILIAVPMLVLFALDYTEGSVFDRFLLAFLQAVTPRTAGFNTADLGKLSGAGSLMYIVLMLIGGSPGSTAGGLKTTTVAVLCANAAAVFHRKKNAELFGRRIEDSVIRDASTILAMYLALSMTAAAVISAMENLPIGDCIFETASAIGTVGLSLGLTPSLGLTSHLILILLMFFGRVGGLTLMYAALTRNAAEISKRPVEKIAVG